MRVQTVIGAFAAAALANSGDWHSVPVKLNDFFNNKAFGSRPGEAALDALGSSFPAAPVGHKGIYTSKATGVEYLFPGYSQHAKADNVICDGQTIPLPPSDKYFSVSLLLVSDVRGANVGGNLTLLYSDNTTSSAEVRAEAFWWFLGIRRGEIVFPYYFTNNNTNHNASDIYERYATIDPGKTLSAIKLPITNNATTGRLHLFSLSLWRSEESLEVQYVRPTQNLDAKGRQIVEVLVNHPGSGCLSNISVTIEARGVRTVEPALIGRLCAGDQKVVGIVVTGQSKGHVKVLFDAQGCKLEKSFEADIGVNKWTTAPSSLRQHESPLWYNNAKFGIFIHWGPYAVPGWGNSTPHESYAEWFWWYSTRVGKSAPADRSGFNAYRLRTFGPDLNYDDFFANYTAAKFDPKAWVDLFATAGARYFVLTSKHHDGFANFNTGSTTNRSALHYGPHRDILGDLFDAAAKHQPQLKRGTYFSLPEWFNPDYGRYGMAESSAVTSTSWPGIIARNPYTGKNEPYTGRIPVQDFIQDVMVPQMEILAYNYKTDIMWCDTGAANGTDGFAAKWFNRARSDGRQVAINDRCGSPWVADFDTPEYQTFGTAQRRKWETNMGMDPYSYGFNRATPDGAYMNATTLVRSLVDIVSKNGNLLLNIGPRADGTIHEAMVKGLTDAGAWIHAHGEAIFNTTYWYVTPEEGDLRFTQTNDAFYILSLKKPSLGRLLLDSNVPAQQGDKVTAVGMHGERDVEFGFKAGKFWIDVTDEVVKADMYCWVFKVKYSAK